MNRCSILFLLLLIQSITLPGCKRKETFSIDYLGQQPPGMVAKLFAPGVISTKNFEHSAPAFSPDGSLVLWTVVDKAYRASLYEMKYERGKWSAPYRPSFADSTADDYYPSFSADGKKLYFSSRRKTPPGYPATPDMRIWEVERNGNGWGVTVPFDTTASKGVDYAHSVARNNTIYFASALGGGTNWNIEVSESANGSYTKPALLPYSINSVDYEEGPCIAPDESFLIFESQRPEGIECSLDLYIAFKTAKGQWGMPVNMGPSVNSASAERFARLSPDGKYLFFGSNRTMSADSWGFDVYWIDANVIEELRKDEVAKTTIEQPLGDQVIEALHANDVASAADGLKKWLALYPRSLDATVTYCALLRKQKFYLQAEQLLTDHSSRWNKNRSIVMEMALVKFGLHKDDEAAKLAAPMLGKGDQERQSYIYLSNELLDMAMFAQSEAYFEKAMTISSNPFEYHRRARKYARIRERDKAFENLYKAVALGFNSRQALENDLDLESLKADRRFRELLKKLN